jgi:hypothetical protein
MLWVPEHRFLFLCGFFPLFGCFKWFVVLKSVCVLRECLAFFLDCGRLLLD